MEKINFCLMDINKDKKEINDWQNRFAETSGWKAIYEFVLERGTIYSLNELIETNYEIVPIGENERKFAFSIKNQSGEIIAFSICQEFDLDTIAPELFMQYITVRPDKQGQGIGRQIYNRIPDEVGKLTGKKPISGFAIVSKYNRPSLKILQEMGFSQGDEHEGFLKMDALFLKEKDQTKFFIDKSTGHLIAYNFRTNVISYFVANKKSWISEYCHLDQFREDAKESVFEVENEKAMKLAGNNLSIKDIENGKES